MLYRYRIFFLALYTQHVSSVKLKFIAQSIIKMFKKSSSVVPHCLLRTSLLLYLTHVYALLR